MNQYNLNYHLLLFQSLFSLIFYLELLIVFDLIGLYCQEILRSLLIFEIQLLFVLENVLFSDNFLESFHFLIDNLLLNY